MAYKQMVPELQKALQVLLEYNHEEERHFLEVANFDEYNPNRAKTHIYHRIVLLQRWLDGTINRDGEPAK
jgi:hypothetical protein